MSQSASARVLKWLIPAAGLAGLAAAAYWTQDRWLPLLQPAPPPVSVAGEGHSATQPTGKVLLSDQAIANLGLKALPIQPGTYWKTIQVPGMIVDRPGQSDRGVVAPVAGVVSQINFVPGDTVKPGEVLFTIRILSETLHAAQADLFKATQDIKLAQAQRQRLGTAGGALPEARLIEVDNQITRLEVAVKAYRRELLNRGLTLAQIDEVAQGHFVGEITIAAPTRAPIRPSAPPLMELQDLNVELGQQVQAGQTLCLLANHQLLAIEGRAFPDETPLLERSVQQRWPVEVDFQEHADAGWKPLEQTLRIRYLANTIDPVSRTFAFQIPLDNEARVVSEAGRTQLLWRFRPGQRVRVRVRVEAWEGVFVLPAQAVVRDGADAYVFIQNENTFERRAVRMLALDRWHAVLAHDGTLLPGMFVVQNGGAQLQRIASAGATGVPKGYHMHADGTLHKNDDPEN
ncbi:MAG TPA: efflux RND transporter periplasmic adaptor subunit [Gemmatales bacterium]|nr:efflux RND transporter periplasmic adaptor subunit [Gemmatales bacterium]